MRLLVAEDERDLNRLLQKVLTKAGYTVDGCYDGRRRCSTSRRRPTTPWCWT